MIRLVLFAVACTGALLSGCSGSSSSSSDSEEGPLSFRAAAQWPTSLSQNSWFLVEPPEGQTWIYQGYATGDQGAASTNSVAISDEWSFAYSFGYHWDSIIAANVLYVERSTVVTSIYNDDAWVSNETQGWIYSENGGLFYIGASTGGGVFNYSAGVALLPETGPTLNQQWDSNRRQLVSQNMTVTTPYGAFNDVYQISIGDGSSIDRYEYWSASHGGLVAIEENPGGPSERWYRLARIVDGPSWHVPFSVQKTDLIPSDLYYAQ